MSLKTWKEEFYPIEASKCPEGQELEHSITKWKGLRLENVRKHDLSANHDTILGHYYEQPFSNNSSSCALCQKFSCQINPLPDAPNNICPIQKVTNHTCRNVYWHYISFHDPEPMIMLLEEVKKKTISSKRVELFFADGLFHEVMYIDNKPIDHLTSIEQNPIVLRHFVLPRFYFFFTHASRICIVSAEVTV